MTISPKPKNPHAPNPGITPQNWLEHALRANGWWTRYSNAKSSGTEAQFWTGTQRARFKQLYVLRRLGAELLRTGKQSIENQDLIEYGLGGLLEATGGNIANALEELSSGLREAGIESPLPSAALRRRRGTLPGIATLMHMIHDTTSERPDEALATPDRHRWDRESTRVEELRRLARRLKKRVIDITGWELKENGLEGMLAHYDKDLLRALNEAMAFKLKKDRIDAITRLAKKLQKPPSNIMAIDFENAGLQAMLGSYYGGSPYRALLDAGLVTRADCDYMRHRLARPLKQLTRPPWASDNSALLRVEQHVVKRP